MKTTRLIWIFTGLFSCLSIACGGGKTDANGFGGTEELRADSVVIREIMQPRRYAVSGDKMLLLTDKGDSLAYVYRFPEVEFLYKGLRVGNGPDEIPSVYPEIVNRYQQGGLFSITCSGILFDLAATDTGLVVRGMKRIGQGGFSDAPVPPTDSLMVKDGINAKGDAVLLYLRDMVTGRVLDSAASQAVLHPERAGGYYENGSWGVQNGEKYAAVYPETGRIEFYDISGGKLALKKTWGDGTPAAELKNTDFYGREKGTEYYESRTDGKYLYVLEAGYQMDDQGTRLVKTADVMVYDWDGNPVKKYHLDKAVNSMMAGSGKLYAFNWDEDFEKIYVYDLGV